MTDAVTHPSSQYLTFRLDREVFAVEIARVREVLELSTITKVPRTPDFVRGVINLRGNVVPVVDVRRKLGMSDTERTVDTCVVITEVALDGERTVTVLGALVDAVQEVIDLDVGSIQPAPKVGNVGKLGEVGNIGTGGDTGAVRGMGRYEDRFLIVLDIDRIFSADDASVLSGAASSAEKEGAGGDARS